ncbi:MAG: lysophospholipid acyltransferase family protein [Acidimicrobiales bacterium]
MQFTPAEAPRGVRRAAGLAGRIGFAAYAWLVLGFLASLALLAVVLLPGQRRRRAVVYRLDRALIRLTLTPLRVDGEEHLTLPGAFVIVANHASYLDSFVLAAVISDRATFVAGEVFATKMLTGFFLGRLGIEFVEHAKPDGTGGTTPRLAEVARSGTPLVFVPEGGLSSSRGLRPFHHGAFVVAAGVGCPVVPIAISGTREMVPPGRRLVRHGRVHLVVGAPLHPAGSDWDAAVELGERARAAIAHDTAEPDVS